MTSKRPAIMEGPLHHAVTILQPFKQHLNIDIVTMNIV